MQPIDRGALRALAAAATPGPWRYDGGPDRRARESARGDTVAEAWISVADARYIAAVSPGVLLALLDALDAAERALAQARADVRRFGIHECDCASERSGVARDCDCGYREALERAEGSK